MTGTPRTPASRCSHGCGCPACVDELAAWLGELGRPRDGDRWQAVDLTRTERRRHHLVDLDGFDADMAALTARARGGRS